MSCPPCDLFSYSGFKQVLILLILSSTAAFAQIGHQDTLRFEDGRIYILEVLDLAAKDYRNYSLSIGPSVAYLQAQVAVSGQLNWEWQAAEPLRLQGKAALGLPLSLGFEIGGMEVEESPNLLGDYSLNVFYSLRQRESIRPASITLAQENHGDHIVTYETMFQRPVCISLEVIGGLRMIQRPVNYEAEGMSLRPNEIQQRGLDTSLYHGIHSLSNFNLELGIASRVTSSVFYAKNGELESSYQSGLVYAKMLLSLSRQLALFSFDQAMTRPGLLSRELRLLPDQDGEGILASPVGAAIGGQLIFSRGKGFHGLALNLELWPHLNRQSTFSENVFANLTYTYGFGSSVRKAHARAIVERED